MSKNKNLYDNRNYSKIHHDINNNHNKIRNNDNKDEKDADTGV